MKFWQFTVLCATVTLSLIAYFVLMLKGLPAQYNRLAFIIFVLLAVGLSCRDSRSIFVPVDEDVDIEIR